ncbi:hypothetical protein HNV12_01170 [Methanococcoides sp. SA1]|nr:hypothetical protein [Methanococcoides sp. SA1]
MLTEKIAEKYDIHGYTSEEKYIQFWKETVERKHPHIKINTLEDLANIPHKIISKTLKQIQTPRAKKKNTERWKTKIAPKKTIMKDLKSTIKNNPTMLISPKMEKAFHIRAIEGHAREGHGKFTYKIPSFGTIKDSYPNTTTQYVLEAIEQTEAKEIEKEIRKRRRKAQEKLKKTGNKKVNKETILNQKAIKESYKRQTTKKRFQLESQQTNDNIVYQMENWLSDMIKNPAKIESMSRFTKLKNSKKPLNQMDCLNGTVDMLEVLRGFYLAANMDDFQGTRTDGFEQYGHQIGGGECHLASTQKLQEYGIGITDLSSSSYKDACKILGHIPNKKRLDVLEDLGVITRKTLPLEEIAKGEFTWNKIKCHPSTTDLEKNPEYWGQYIRDTKGDGVGDDLVIFLAGFLPSSIYDENHEESDVAIQSRIIGALLADQMDTVEKDAKIFIPGGQDKIAAMHINGLFNKLCNLKIHNPRKDKYRDYGEEFREKLNIKEKTDGKYTLVPHQEVVDYTVAGANPEEHIHSSQRWFYKSINGTCAISEYMKHAYFCGRANNQPIYLEDLKSFKFDAEEDKPRTKLTFGQIPLKKIRETMNERLHLVKNPKERKQRIRKHYSIRKAA